MRGQRLFVRPIEPGDADTVRGFLAVHAAQDAVPPCGLIGKLLGELVAVMAIDLGETNGVRIRDLVVAPELRLKRIARVMMIEVESLAAKMERDWLIAEGAGSSREFLKRVGFIDEGTRMVRRVAR